VNDHVKSASGGAKDLDALQLENVLEGVTPESRQILGRAARLRKAGWFKSVTWMEDVARDIVGPDLVNADLGLRELVEDLFTWASNAGQ